jgi:transcriptional regulator
MYLPAAFAETDPTQLHEFIERHSFGTLVSQFEGRPFATHVPFLLERTTSPHGTLVGHMARANSQWTEFNGQTALAIFTGPHAYISPTWYESENVVPTWNYSAVHVYGRAETIESADGLLDIVQRSVRFYEAPMPAPWTFDGSSTFIERMLSQIVGFRIAIERIEGKFKLNQNHPAERRRKVVRALRERDDENSQGVADLMEARENIL